MKILSSEQSRAADAYTIEHHNIASIDLMERAAHRCVEALLENYITATHFSVFCGMGNNGGDGLAMARLLVERNFSVSVYTIAFRKDFSPDAARNIERLTEMGIPVRSISSESDIPSIKEGIIIDAIFGSGLGRSVTGIAASVIQHINEVPLPVVSIDIPSGLFGEDNTSNTTSTIVRSDLTICIQSPKLALLLPDNSAYNKAFTIVDIGLDLDYINRLPSDYFYSDPNWVKTLFKVKNKFDHKGTNGHPLIIAGQEGMMGAALLSAEACLRSGAGLVTLHSPQCGYDIIQTRLPEVIVSKNDGIRHLTLPLPSIPEVLAIGPGIGRHDETGHFLHSLLQQSQSPMVLDADALNWMADNPEWYNHIPKNSILTPHPKEFERLTRPWSNDNEKLEQLKAWSQTIGSIVVLKGAHTTIAMPNGEVYFNSTGNPGMATAGSGDVLTGVITGLLAQGYSPKHAAILGVFIHGLAGDFAAERTGMEAMIASDLIHNLGRVFTSLYPAP